MSECVTLYGPFPQGKTWGEGRGTHVLVAPCSIHMCVWLSLPARFTFSCLGDSTPFAGGISLRGASLRRLKGGPGFLWERAYQGGRGWWEGKGGEGGNLTHPSNSALAPLPALTPNCRHSPPLPPFPSQYVGRYMSSMSSSLLHCVGGLAWREKKHWVGHETQKHPKCPLQTQLLFLSFLSLLFYLKPSFSGFFSPSLILPHIYFFPLQ